MIRQRGFLWLRALVAIAFHVGFYLFAISLGLFFMFGPLIAMAYASELGVRRVRIPAGGILALFLMGGAILYSLRPRIEKPDLPDGLLVSRDDQPRLFELIDDVAARTEQRPPDRVFLDLSVNAGVTQEGGLLTLHPRRTMILGLPLLAVLDRDQLSAVLAHEFGHYLGGDTALGSVAYRTRRALQNTIDELRSSGDTKQFAAIIFSAYAKLYLRITRGFSRAQEYAADQLAAAVYGPNHLSKALLQVHKAAPLYDIYWSSELAPVLDSGSRPPISAGFKTFLKSQAETSGFQLLIAMILAAEPGPYDSHPPLAERLGALDDSSEDGADDDEGEEEQPEGAAAIELITGLDKVESAALESALGGPYGPASALLRRLKKRGWSEASRHAALTNARVMVTELRPRLESLSAPHLPETFRNFSAYAGQFVTEEERARAESAEELNEAVAGILAQAWTLALVHGGGAIETDLGEPVHVRFGESRFDPQEVLAEAAKGERDLAAFYAENGLGELADIPFTELCGEDALTQ